MKTTSLNNTSPSKPLPPSVRVDVKLCGSMSRQQIADTYRQQPPRGSPCGEVTSSHLNQFQDKASNSCTLALKTSLYTGLQGIVSNNRNSGDSSRIQPSSVVPLPAQYEPPSWSVPARGEARLEPVCEALGRQTSVDLSTQSSYRIGRSPLNDVQLQHGTSSRRHALLFHHANGNCYIVDCGSAHGTYVNGVRIHSPPNGGVVVPTKVRRGAMIRFGGPGAPCFVLKSFTFQLDELVEAEASCSPLERTESDEEAVQKNTRLNALGQTAMDSIRFSLSQMSKRSFDSLDGAETFDDEPCSKRARCSSPPLFPEEPLRLVSPDVQPTHKQRRVSFSAEPPVAFYPALVTPGDLSEQEDNGTH